MENQTLASRTEILNKAWTDNEFMSQLENDPRAALGSVGAKIPANVNVKVVRDTGNVRYLHIPRPPAEGELSDTDLLNAQAGTAFVCASIVLSIVSAAGGGGVSASVALTT